MFRLNSLRSLSGIDGPVASPQASIGKLFWGTWHRDLGELAVDVAGLAAVAGDWAVTDHVDEPDGVGGYPLTELQRSFLFSRADTIYGGSNQIQRTIIGERVLGLPAEPKPAR